LGEGREMGVLDCIAWLATGETSLQRLNGNDNEVVYRTGDEPCRVPTYSASLRRRWSELKQLPALV
jgi:hypothetical protein